jgi:predicted enzyme related to lactoylglutathione lyase
MARNIKLLVYPVKDIEKAKAFYGPIAYTDVKDIKSSLQVMVKVGAKVVQDVKEVGGGLLIAQVKDVDGNVVGLRQQS